MFCKISLCLFFMFFWRTLSRFFNEPECTPVNKLMWFMDTVGIFSNYQNLWAHISLSLLTILNVQKMHPRIDFEIWCIQLQVQQQSEEHAERKGKLMAFGGIKIKEMATRN
jgi:hypothetical protein